MFSIASLTDLVQRARAAFRAYLPGTDAWIWPNNVYVTAKVIGGSNEEVMGRLAFVAKQAFAATAEGPYLDRHGADLKLPRKDKDQAAGTATIAAPDAMVMPAGARLVRSDGVAYVVTADQSVAAAGNFDVNVLAIVAGADGNAETGTPLTLAPSLDGAARASGPGAATATAQVGTIAIADGSDVELDGPPFSTDLSTYRGRILFRKANPPRGGAPADWVVWATANTGVTRVFVERLVEGPGSIRIYPIFDDVFAATGGVADTAHVEAVIDAIAPLAPPADWSVMAPASLPIDVTITGLQPLSTPVETAIRAELTDTFRRLGKVSGSDTPVAALPFLATPQTFSRSWISQAIANATGEERHVLVVPAADVTIPAGALPVLGNLSFA